MIVFFGTATINFQFCFEIKPKHLAKHLHLPVSNIIYDVVAVYSGSVDTILWATFTEPQKYLTNTWTGSMLITWQSAYSSDFVFVCLLFISLKPLIAINWLHLIMCFTDTKSRGNFADCKKNFIEIAPGTESSTKVNVIRARQY